VRLLPCGELALLVECEEGQVAPVVSALSGLDAEVVPAARTVLVRVGTAAELPGARRRVAGLLDRPLPPVPSATAERTVTLPVVYDGEDLREVAALTGLSADAVVAAHTARPWRVAFSGFAPGFAYLDGGDPRLVVPRRATPRTSVPAGSVGLAGQYSGIYPRSSPGGWQLIGHTTVNLWELERTPPALLRPGWWVQFEEVR
jgi:KipI family sensor histidine kinase inhibitor